MIELSGYEFRRDADGDWIGSINSGHEILFRPAAETLSAALDEIERLRAIVSKNPTWADGTPVTSGSTGYSVDRDECPVRLTATFETQEDAKQRQRFERWYPTREAAEAARKEKP